MIGRLKENELARDFLASPVTLIAAIIALLLILAALFAPLIAPQNPFDPSELVLMDFETRPMQVAAGSGERYLMGTDMQGRDIFSAILYGMRISLLVGFAAVLFSALLGVALGIAAGYAGGWFAAGVMRLADVQLTIPGILIALLIDGLARILFPGFREAAALWVLIFAIGLAEWPQYARVTRAATMGEMTRDYVAAARLMGGGGWHIMARHVLPNVLGPVFVLATLGLALAIITEATLSFLGVGMPPTTPSLGTLIREGNDFLLSGSWWITLFPAGALVVLVLSVNLVGDWLRDALNPRLRRGR